MRRPRILRRRHTKQARISPSRVLPRPLRPGRDPSPHLYLALLVSVLIGTVLVVLAAWLVVELLHGSSSPGAPNPPPAAPHEVPAEPPDRDA